ncbi:PAS domain-containing protein [Roseinatronobacter alkalisoli]|uniref:PAS domain-containing protein n=1 Tax=Roseinatronobacter alkalisoli TaxID=3028235 RepID=A0ABT5T815_9RHOB|nr:PAS domain-containing protein [Roseinatronobacter sp. HJB301]MDD7971261.1 PAS domain-containing protein [Roseinatronobacter sp. HJB301]
MTETIFTTADTTAFSATANTDSTGYRTIDRVCAYWASLPKTGAAPNRMLIDARALSDVLPHVFLAELATPRVARLRIIGHRIEELTGLDMRGMPLTTLFSGPAREEIMTACEQVSRGARVSLSLKGEAGFARPQLDGMLAMMPLCDTKGNITRILGVFGHQGEIGRAPRRFDLAHRSSCQNQRRHQNRNPRQHHFCASFRAAKPEQATDRAVHEKWRRAYAAAPLSVCRCGDHPNKAPAAAGSPVARAACYIAAASFSRRPTSSSATRNASSNDWLAFSRGSHAV